MQIGHTFVKKQKDFISLCTDNQPYMGIFYIKVVK